jgi:hypothetical protein
LVDSGVTEEDLIQIRTCVKKCRALGDERFLTALEARLARPVLPRDRGRPQRGQIEKLT